MEDNVLVSNKYDKAIFLQYLEEVQILWISKKNNNNLTTYLMTALVVGAGWELPLIAPFIWLSCCC